MTLLDIIVLIALAIFFFKGFHLGLVRGIGVLIGLVVGLWVAGQYYDEAARWVVTWGIPEAFASAAGYIVMFIASVWGVSILVWMADRVFKFLAVIPGMNFLNSVLGGVLFLIEGIIIIGVVLYVVGQFSPADSGTKRTIERSRVAYLVKAASWVAAPLIPASIEQFKRVVPTSSLLDEQGELRNLPSSPWGFRD